MMNMKGADAFERSLKEALEAYEVPYNSADWTQLEKRLGSGRTTSWQSAAGLYALLLGGTMAVATTVYLMVNAPDPHFGAGGQVALVQEEQDQDMPHGHSGLRLETADADGARIPNDVADSTSPVVEVKEASRESTGSLAATPASGNGNRVSERTGTGVQRNTRSEAALGEPATGNRAGTSGGVVDAAAAKPAPASKAIAIRPSVTEGCPGTTIEFSVDNMPSDGMFLWNFGDGSFSKEPKPNHTFSKAGTFEVMLSHSSMGGGSIRSKPAADRIVIHEAPEAAFNYVPRTFENTVPSVHFENRSMGGSKYLWEFGDGSTSTAAHPDHVYKKRGTYQVTLTTTNANGCVDRTERSLVIDKDYNLLAPKTFSPDGNGVEDTFLPEALKTLGVRFHMSIFNSRTGELIYETTDPQRPWNGRIANKGELCAPGEYVWLVEMKDGEKLGGTYTGNVGLIR
jgi:PKD repeat protein